MSSNKNIILIVVDTLRNDTTLIEGNDSDIFREFLRDCSIQTDVLSPSPWTLPSHFSIFTGKYVSEHKVDRIYGETSYEELLNRIRKSKIRLITEELREMGYSTHGYSANPFVSPETGFDRGFESFVTIDQRRLSEYVQSNLDKIKSLGNTYPDILKSLLVSGKLGSIIRLPFLYSRFMNEQKINDFPRNKGGIQTIDLFKRTSLRKPFFLFFNFMEMHEPYLLKETLRNPFGGFHDILGISKISENDLTSMKSIYNDQAVTVKNLLAELFDHLKNINCYDDSLIIVTSDHGQAFKENGYYGHGLFLYDPIIWVPLLIKYPKNETFEQTNFISLIDLYVLIKKFVTGEMPRYYSNERTVFSESYGTFIEQRDLIEHPRAISSVSKINSSRKAAYRGGFKLTVNGTTGEVEEFSFNGKHLDPSEDINTYYSLLEEIYIFKGREKFKVPIK